MRKDNRRGIELECSLDDDAWIDAGAIDCAVKGAITETLRRFPL